MSATPNGCHHCKYKHLKATLFVKQLLMSPSGNSGHLAMGHGNAPPVTITAVPVFSAPPRPPALQLASSFSTIIIYTPNPSAASSIHMSCFTFHH
ncbi:hypothetical protein V6N13_119427 [Hibiscus sabdariffa]